MRVGVRLSFVAMAGVFLTFAMPVSVYGQKGKDVPIPDEITIGPRSSFPYYQHFGITNPTWKKMGSFCYVELASKSTKALEVDLEVTFKIRKGDVKRTYTITKPMLAGEKRNVYFAVQMNAVQQWDADTPVSFKVKKTTPVDLSNDELAEHKERSRILNGLKIANYGVDFSEFGFGSTRFELVNRNKEKVEGVKVLLVISNEKGVPFYTSVYNVATVKPNEAKLISGVDPIHYFGTPVPLTKDNVGTYIIRVMDFADFNFSKASSRLEGNEPPRPVQANAKEEPKDVQPEDPVAARKQLGSIEIDLRAAEALFINAANRVKEYDDWNRSERRKQANDPSYRRDSFELTLKGTRNMQDVAARSRASLQISQLISAKIRIAEILPATERLALVQDDIRLVEAVNRVHPAAGAGILVRLVGLRGSLQRSVENASK